MSPGAALCPCCGFATLPDGDSYGICPVCFWEDDGTEAADERSGANRMTLREARANFLKFGAMQPDVRDQVRAPSPDEYPRASS